MDVDELIKGTISQQANRGSIFCRNKTRDLNDVCGEGPLNVSEIYDGIKPSNAIKLGQIY